MFILDSTAVAITLKRLKEKSVEALGDKTVLDLTGYELGNMVWKECALKNLMGLEEAVEKAGDIAKMLGILNVEKISSIKDFRLVMRLAAGLKLTFYDASYLYVAESRKLTLVTEDEELAEKAGEASVKAVAVSGFLEAEDNSPKDG